MIKFPQKNTKLFMQIRHGNTVTGVSAEGGKDND